LQVQCDECAGWFHADCVAGGCDFDAVKRDDAAFFCAGCR